MRFKLVGNQRVSPNADISPSQLCAVCQGSVCLMIGKQCSSLVCFRLQIQLNVSTTAFALVKVNLLVRSLASLSLSVFF